ncbi:unnamed protein product [Meganyctiphanes norvegica]|uniref:C-type lectin domain-containing protein n=1 Tax=Meganyctiphanes norvegica TaxID=48144 RepID=A0AAV2SKJ9_MEGNR
MEVNIKISKLDEKLEATSSLSNKLHSATMKMNKLDEKIEIMSGMLGSIEMAADASNEKDSFILPKVNTIANGIDAITGSIDSFGHELEELKISISLFEKEMENRTINDSEIINDNINSLHTEFKESLENLSQIENYQEENIINNFSNVSADILSISNKMDKLGIVINETATQHESRIINIELNISSLGDTINNIIPSIGSVDQQVSTVNTKLNNMISAFLNIINIIKSIKSDMASNSDKFQSLEQISKVIADGFTEMRYNLISVDGNISKVLDITGNLSNNLANTSSMIQEVLQQTATYLSLKWLTVGHDMFVMFNQTMHWPDARALCKRYKLDLYQPIGILMVANYLDDNFSNTRYWVGSHGNGTHQVWLSGEILTKDGNPWHDDDRMAYNVGSNQCSYLLLNNWWAESNKKRILFSVTCTSREASVLCG